MAVGQVMPDPGIGTTGNVYFGLVDGMLYARGPSGNVLWELNLGTPVHTSPALLPDNSILIGTDDGRLISVDSNSGGLANTDGPMTGRDLQRRSSQSLLP